MAKQRPHYGVSTTYEPVRSQQVRPKTHPPSQAKLREAALNSSDGGRMMCDYCQHYFAASYVRLVRNDVWLGEPRPACYDCRKSKNLITL